MSYRLDQKQAEMFARTIMPALYRLQKAKNIHDALVRKRPYVMNDKYDITAGSQRYVRYEKPITSSGKNDMKP